MEEKKIYPSTQLIALLHPKVLKVYMYLLGWQSTKSLKIYQKNLAKYTKLSEKDIEISIQTLIDNKLIQVTYNGDFEVTFNREEPSKYFSIPIEEISSMELLPVSTSVTWNKQTFSANSIEDLTEDQIKALLLRLQVSLNEKQQLKKLVVNQEKTDDLPF